MANLVRALSVFVGQRPDFIKLCLMFAVEFLGMNLLCRPYYEGTLEQNGLPVRHAVVKEFSCSGSGEPRAVYIPSHGHRAYPFSFLWNEKERWVNLSHGLLLGRLAASLLVPPGYYTHHVSAVLNGLHRILVLLFHLALFFPVTHPVEPIQKAVWCLKMAPIIDVSSVGLFQIGFWGEALYGIIAMVCSAWLALNFKRAQLDVDYKLSSVILRQLTCTAAILAFEKFVRPLYNSFGIRFLRLLWPGPWRACCTRVAGWQRLEMSKDLNHASKAPEEGAVWMQAEAAAATSTGATPKAGSSVCRRHRRPASTLLSEPSLTAGQGAEVERAASGAGASGFHRVELLPSLQESHTAAPGASAAVSRAATVPPTSAMSEVGAERADGGDGPGAAVAAAASDDSARSSSESRTYRPYSRSGALALAAAAAVCGRDGDGEPSLPRLTMGPVVSGAAAADRGAPVPRLRGYVGRTVLLTTAIKIRGAHPEDVAPGYEQRIAKVLAASNLELEGVFIRSGCIELVVDARIWEGRRNGGAAGGAGDGGAGGDDAGAMARGRRAGAEAIRPLHQHQHHHLNQQGHLQCQHQPGVTGGSSLPSERASGAAVVPTSAVSGCSSPTSTGDFASAKSSAVAADCGLLDELSAATASTCGGDSSPEHDAGLGHNSPPSKLLGPLACVTDCGGAAAAAAAAAGSTAVCFWPCGCEGDVLDPGGDGYGDGSRAVDVGELIRALELPPDGISTECSRSVMDLCEEREGSLAEVVTLGMQVMMAGPGAAPQPLPPPPPPQLLSVSPRVLPTRSCRVDGGGSGASAVSTGNPRSSTNRRSGSSAAGADGGEGGQTRRLETVELVLLVACSSGRVPELLVRSHGAFLSATVTGCMSVGAPASAGVRGDSDGAASASSSASAAGGDGVPALEVLLCTVALPLAALPEESGLLVVEVRWTGQTHGSAVPLLMADDAELAAELQAAVEDWRGPSLEMEDMLLDLACFLYHAGRLRSSPPPAAAAAPPPPPHITLAAPLAADSSDMYEMNGLPGSVMRERVSELGLHLLAWMGSCPAGWLRSMGRLQSDLVVLGTDADLIFQARSSSLHYRNYPLPPQHLHPAQGGHYPQGQQYHMPLGYHSHPHLHQYGARTGVVVVGGGGGSSISLEADSDDLRTSDNQKASHAGGRPPALGSLRPVGVSEELNTRSAAAAAATAPPAARASWFPDSFPSSSDAGRLVHPQQHEDGEIDGNEQFRVFYYGAGLGEAVGTAGRGASVTHGVPVAMAAVAEVEDTAATAAEPNRELDSLPGSDGAATALAAATGAVVAPSSPSNPSRLGSIAAPPSCDVVDPCVTTAETELGCTPRKAAIALREHRRPPGSLSVALAWMRWVRAEYGCLTTNGYLAFLTEYTAELMNAIDVFNLTCLLVLTARSYWEMFAAATAAATCIPVTTIITSSSSSSVGAGAVPVAPAERWRHFLRTLVPAAVSCVPSVIASLSRVFLSRAAWLRLQCALRLPRLLLFCVAGALIAWLGFPAAGAIRSYQLSFVGDGGVHIISPLALPIPTLLIALVRMPLHVALWEALGANFEPGWGTVRAAAVVCLSVASSVCCHAYLLALYRRCCRQLGAVRTCAITALGGGAGSCGAARRWERG